jgi:TP901 family phage tail tape measure protein
VASQFDAVARISLDLRAFSQGAQQVTKAGGSMEQIFKNLNKTLQHVGQVNKTQAGELNRALGVYQKMIGVVRSYASMVTALGKAQSSSVNGTKAMEKTFEKLAKVMATMRGMGEKEHQRLQRTLSLYTQMATVLQRMATAQNQMSAATQRGTQAQAAEAKERDRAKKAITDQAIAEERLAQAKLKTAQAQANAANSQAQSNQRVASSASQVATAQANANRTGAQLTATDQRLTQATRALALAQQNAARTAQIAQQAQTRGSTFAVQAQRQAAQAAQAVQRALVALANAQQASARAQQTLNQRLREGGAAGNILRQDLSELETAYRRMSQTATSAVESVVGAAISHESAFAQLARVTKVTGAESENLKRQFEELATTEPISFEDVAKVGQLAAQTGVATEQLQQFSRTVIRFSVTTGIASDQVAVLFGRIGNMQNLPTQQMGNFASMVLAVGTASAATEDEILKVTQAISTSSTMFGLTTQDIGGLAGALASLRVPPEWSRGTTTRIFRELDDAVKSSGAELGILTDVMGLTAEEIKNLRSTDPGEFFRQFVQGMGKYTDTTKSAEEATASVANVLRSLGVGAVRDIEFISRLASNFDTLADQTNIATIAFSKNSELADQTAILYDTARVKIDNMIDAFGTFLAGVGKEIIIVLGDIASFTTDLIEGFQELPAVFKYFATGSVAVLGFAAALAALRMAAFQTLRSMVAMRETQQRLGVQSLSLTNIMRAYRDSSNQAARSNSNLQRSYLGNIQAAREEARTRRESISAFNDQARAAQANALVQQRTALNGVNAARQEIQAIRDRAAAGQALISDGQRMATQQARMTSATQRYIVATNEASAATQRLAAVGNVSTTGMAARLSAVGVAARAAAGGVTLLGAAFSAIAVGAIITGIVTLYQEFTKADTAIRDAAQAGFEAAGGLTALGDAIAADTAAAKEGGGVIRELTIAAADLSAEERKSAEQRRKNAEAEQTRITALFGTIEALREQAKGTDDAAKRARAYVAEWDEAQKTIDQVTNALSEHKIVLEDDAQAMLENTVRQSVMTNEIFKTEGAMRALNNSSLELQQAMTSALENPEDAAKILQGELDEIDQKMQDLKGRGIVDIDQFDKEMRGLAEEKAAIALIAESLNLFEGNLQKSAATNLLFGDSAAKASGDAEELANSLDEADSNASSLSTDITAMASAIGASLDPMRALQAGFEAIEFESADSFVAAFRAGKINIEAMTKSFDAFSQAIKDQLTVTRDWEKNLVRAVNELSPAVASAFRDMGIDAAPMLAQALKLGDKEKADFIAQMSAYGKQGQEAFGAAVTKGQVAIAGKGAETGQLFADATANALDQAMKPGGSVQKATKALETLGDLISKDVITKEIALDLEKFRGDATKLQTYALSLVQSGALDIKAAAELVTALYTGEASQLADWVKAQNAVGAFDLNGDATLDDAEYAAAVARLEAQVNLLNASDALDLNAEGKLTTEQYTTEMTKLEELVTLVVGSGALDPKAEAKLTTEQFETTMDALNTLAKARGEAGDFDADGNGKLDPAEYLRVLELLKGIAQSQQTKSGLSPTGTPNVYPDVFQQGLNKLREWTGKWRDRLNGWMDPTPEVNQSAFDSDLQQMRQNSWSTGETIQANLTRSATVSVGYYYYQKNSPPSTMEAATGGWIAGPGTGTSDSIPAMLSDGEFVINAKQASRFGALLEAINSGRYGRGYGYPQFASGGSVNVRKVSLRQMQSGSGMIQRMPANSQVPRIAMIGGGAGTRITVNNQYPQAEPTSTTINRSLAYAATLNGV